MALRILLTCKYLPPELEGGGALTVFALARALADEGLDVTILKARSSKDVDRSSWGDFRIVEAEYRDRFDYRASGLPDFYAHLAAKRFNHRSYRRSLARVLATGEFDILHAQNHTTALAAASFKPGLSIPVAATLRGHGLWCFVLGKALPDGSPCSGCVTENQIPCLNATSLLSPPTVLPKLALMKSWMRWQRTLTERIDLLLPISSMMADEGRAYNRPLRIIPDLVADLPDAAKPLPDGVQTAINGRSASQRTALYAGRLAPNKGLDLVLDAASASPDWLFLIAGEDPRGHYGDTLRERAEQKNLANVRFLGWVPNDAMAAVYDAVDVVLLPFLRSEPLSRGMVEALARGRTLVATARGGPLDAVEDGVNGVLFDPSRSGLVDALARCARMDLNETGTHSRRVYEERFSPSRIVQAHLEAYETLLAAPKHT